MKIICVYSLDDFVTVEKPLSSFSTIPYGLSYVSTALKQAGNDVEIFVATPKTKIQFQLKNLIEKKNPGLICLTAVSSQYPYICKIAKAIKEIDDSIPIIIGGHHATLNPEETIKKDCFDAICMGEGEAAIVEYAQQISENKHPSSINNLWIKNKTGNGVERNSQNHFVKDLDSFPFINRKMWEPWIFDKNRMPTILIGRGCPNKCSYCSNHALARISSGRYVRYRSPENIINEMEAILEENPLIKSVFFEVETFSVNLKYAAKFCEALKVFNHNRIEKIKFGANISLNKKVVEDEQFLKNLKDANFDFVNLGLESGSEHLRNTVLRRPKYSNEEMIAFCKLAEQMGIHINLYALLGIPGETQSDFYKTIECARACNPRDVFLSIYYPYPGTDLYKMAIDEGFLNLEKFQNNFMERKKSVLNMPGFSKNQIQYQFLIFPYNVYKGRLPFMNIMARVLRGYLSTNVVLNSIFRKIVNSKVFDVVKARFAPFVDK
ncbi:MAG: B12-binding domain-containing radical SAM protein [Desulfobacteraceae bacterium]|nr:B12-binding domain-containing radical SAM protein [Desulfobacteraceae bacterium]